MVSIRRFLNNLNVFQQKLVLCSVLSLLLSACAKTGGTSFQEDHSLSCSIKSANSNSKNEIQDLESDFSSSESAADKTETEPNIKLDPAFDNYIVEFNQTDSQVGLQPSGQPVREFTIAGLSLSLVQGQTYTLSLNKIPNPEVAIQKLNKERSIKFLEPDYPIYQRDDLQAEELTYEDLQNENDEDTVNWDIASQISKQWALTNVQSTQAWQVTRGASDIVVAVIDSGIDYTHNDLKNNIWSNPTETLNGQDDDGNGYIDDIRGWNYVNNNNSPKTTSQSNHGTHVAGIIGAAGSVVGLSQKVKLLPLRFINEAGSGITSQAIRAIDYAISKRVFAINNSWGSTNKSIALQAAISRAEKAGILFVVAAGNGEYGKGYNISNKPYYPASYRNSNIIRVAASKSNNLLTEFSNFSDELVDVAAPGYNILSTVTGNKYMRMSGTSMATPLVTGLAVLIKAANRDLSAVQIRGIINSTVDVIPGLKSWVRTSGRVNARKAVQMAKQIGPDFTVPNCP